LPLPTDISRPSEPPWTTPTPFCGLLFSPKFTATETLSLLLNPPKTPRRTFSPNHSMHLTRRFREDFHEPPFVSNSLPLPSVLRDPSEENFFFLKYCCPPWKFPGRIVFLGFFFCLLCFSFLFLFLGNSLYTSARARGPIRIFLSPPVAPPLLISSRNFLPGLAAPHELQFEPF